MTSRLEAVRASAGAGKTHTLTTHYIRALIMNGGPRSVLATTFTRKAAGEILSRVLMRLLAAAASETVCSRLAQDTGCESLTPQLCRSLVIDLCRHSNLVMVSTIDSFFQSFASPFMLELGRITQGDPVDDQSDLVASARMDAIHAALESIKEPERSALIDDLFVGAPAVAVRGALNEIVSELYSVYQEAAPETWLGLAALDPEPDIDLAQTNAMLLQCAVTETAATAKAIQGIVLLADRSDWREVVGSTLVKAAVTTGLYYRRPISPQLSVALGTLYSYARAQVLSELFSQTIATHDLLTEFDRFYSSLRLERGLTLFSDLPRELAHLFDRMSPDLVSFRAEMPITHLLLDEFQDTSSAQWEIFRPFANQIALDEARAGVFFCVGDTKQSIYGWRGACPEILEGLQAEIPSLQWNFLDRSHRSSQVVLDTVNRIYGQIGTNAAVKDHMAAAEEWGDGFAHHEAVYSSNPGYAVLLTSPAKKATDEDDPVDDSRSARIAVHYEYVADYIKDITREAPGASVGVLTRSNETASLLLHLLRARNLNASGEIQSSVADDPAVEIILSALTLADHPGNSASAFHVLNSPLAEHVGLTGDSASSRADAALSIRSSLIDPGYAETIARWVAALEPACDERGTRRAAQLVQLAALYDTRPSLRPDDFVRFVRSSRVEDPVPAEVRVMTIHGAKGLEFDVVVLPELHNQIKLCSSRVLVERENIMSPITAVFSSAPKEVRCLDPRLEHAYSVQAKREFKEILSLLYVAMTRAKSALHMISPPPGARKDGSARSELFSFSKIIRSGLTEGRVIDPAGGQTLYKAGDRSWHVGQAFPNPYEISTAAYRPVMVSLRSKPEESRVLREVTPSSLEGGGIVNVDDLLRIERTPAEERGLVLHALMQRIEWLDEYRDTDAELVSIARAVAPRQSSEWVSQQVTQFRKVLKQPGVHTLLTRSNQAAGCQESVWRERRFVARVGEHLLRGVFDRLVICGRDGAAERIQIIDFKTGLVSEASLASRTEFYRPQMDAYKSAAMRMFGVTEDLVVASLLFVETGAHVTIAC